ncbi:hypothetical protein C1J05_11220 [Sulfitobacter sp. JL08]|uniref:DUF5906 domain-containing protein n=1 Tax=Sulfitobacter sp. JL08 TaxID=2070369 RepID=UPI000E0BAC43|nr:DUF5906 domain-containing protein [Sulfitobacter sp. JL08]AXI54983.1 hypothetical protein C1J05_11220 [Sulfitobacter sp. JL08]
MKAKEIQGRLAEIAEMSIFEQGRELDALKKECTAAGNPVTKKVLETALRRLIKVRDADEKADEKAAVSSALSTLVAELNMEFFVIEAGSKVRIGHWVKEPTGRKDEGGDDEMREVLNLLTTHDFSTLVANVVAQGPDGPIPAGEAWLVHPERSWYRGTILAPNGPVPDGYLNLWRGYGVKPKEGPCDLILNHIRDVICAGDVQTYEYNLDWIALKVQQPERVMGTMPILISAQGAGKGIIFDDLMMRIFGQHGVVIEDSSQLIGKFNKHLMDACYVFADECFFVGDRRGAQKLKRRVTGKTILLEAKGVDTITVLSALGIVAATNEEHALDVEVKERRYIVQRCNDDRRGDRAYFEALAGHIQGDGAAHFLDKMLKRDVSAFDPEHDRPLTDDTIKQRELSLHGIHRFWAEVVEEGLFPIRPDTPTTFEGWAKVAEHTWADGGLRVSRRSFRDAFLEWARKTQGEGYNDTQPKRMWSRLREVAVFEDDGGNGQDRKVWFASLPEQVEKLGGFLCAR